MKKKLIWDILRILLIIVIVIYAVPLYIFFAIGSLFAFDAPNSATPLRITLLLIMDLLAFSTPIAMITGLILGKKNPKYYILIGIFPLLLFLVMKCFFRF